MAGMVKKEKKRGIPLKTLILPALLLTGVLAGRFELVDWPGLLELSRFYADSWWFPVFVVLLMALAYTLALPGSIFIWISGLLFTPLPAAVIIAAGGVAGGVAAYYFSRRLSDGMTAKVTSSPLYALLQRHGDFIALSAVRLFPGFPHALINYGAGILRLPLRFFILSTLIGFSVKGYLYAVAIHQVTKADEPINFLSWQLILPLLILAALFLAAKLLFKQQESKN